MPVVPVGEVYYVEHVSGDPERTCSLLEAVHGWRFGPADASLGGTRVAVLPDGSRCGVRGSLDPMEKPITRTYVRVGSHKRAAKAAAKQGALVALDSMELGAHGSIAIVILGGVEHGFWELPRAKAANAQKRPTTTHATSTKAAAKRMKPMKAYASFDAYEADQSARNRAVIEGLRKLVKRVAPKLRETVKWGNGCWVTDDANVAFVYSADDHVQFGFFDGAALKDPKKILQGSAKYVRHVKVRKPGDIDQAAFAALVKQAARKA